MRLDEDELWAFLERGHTGILTSLRRDGFPVTLPVWYAVLARTVYVSGPAHTKKWRRIERDSRVSFLVEEGHAWRDLQAVQLTGHEEYRRVALLTHNSVGPSGGYEKLLDLWTGRDANSEDPELPMLRRLGLSDAEISAHFAEARWLETLT